LHSFFCIAKGQVSNKLQRSRSDFEPTKPIEIESYIFVPLSPWNTNRTQVFKILRGQRFCLPVMLSLNNARVID